LITLIIMGEVFILKQTYNINKLYIPAAGCQTVPLVVCTPVAETMTKAHSPLSCATVFHCIQSGTQSIGTDT